ncbi:MAG: hypothetical protein FWG85_00105 [Bacteroidetes bacterium]|nr:hypothetical protein [Bacteroidota bacterium]
MIFCIILLICAFTTAADCLINGGPMTGASITDDIIIADGLDIPNVLK